MNSAPDDVNVFTVPLHVPDNGPLMANHAKATFKLVNGFQPAGCPHCGCLVAVKADAGVIQATTHSTPEGDQAHFLQRGREGGAGHASELNEFHGFVFAGQQMTGQTAGVGR
jgi:hypothetical protein